MKFAPKPTSYKEVQKPCYKCKHGYWAEQYNGMDGPYCIYGMRAEDVPPDTNDVGIGNNGKKSYMSIKMTTTEKITDLARAKYGDDSPKPFRISGWLTQFLEKGWRTWGAFAEERGVSHDGTCDFWEEFIEEGEDK